MNPAQDGVQAMVNDALYARRTLVWSYARRRLRPVEGALLGRYRADLSGRVLELGCGAGRLTGHLCAIGAQVRGVDISAAMVRYCRRAYPQASFEQRDLRDLGGYAAGSFDAVVAPFNVLDVLDDADRREVVDEIGRLLAEGGLLIMSSHNRAAASAIRGPARVLVGDPRRLAGNIVRLARSMRNRRRLLAFQRDEPDYAVLNDCAHTYGLLHYYVTRDAQDRRLAEQGFRLLECLDLDGEPVEAGADGGGCSELHYVARRSNHTGAALAGDRIAGGDGDRASQTTPLEDPVAGADEQTQGAQRSIADANGAVRADPAQAGDGWDGPQARDLAGLARDRDAEARDLATAQWDAIDEQSDARDQVAADVSTGPAEEHDRAELRHSRSVEQRTRAVDDRGGAARDREYSEHERVCARADREGLAKILDGAGGDRLVGAQPSRITMLQEAVRALLRAADTRDETSHARDLAGTARDHAADERDLAMERREDDDAHDAAAQAAAVAGIVRRGVNRRERGAAARSRALDDRRLAAGGSGLAAEDRQDAGLDREQAVGERLLAARNRDTLVRHLAIAETDPLTGARARGAGLTALEQEVDRCRRTGGLLVVAYVDVVGLKALNDAAGHPAGDELLKRVAVLITQNLRSFDLIIRMGGDEFLCAMSNATLPDARRRFRAIDAALTITPGTHAINAGYAELAADDTVAKLIARADGDLLEGRRANPDSRH